MRRITNRDRILQSSVALFNEHGVVAMTTNHIADHLKISPGNLYFHFRNKEEIVRELFEQMCESTYKVWNTSDERFDPGTPLQLLQKSMDVFWDYRFFHREMYHLRRRDPELAKMWRSHIAKTMRLLRATYARWVNAKVMREIRDPSEMQMVSDIVIITSSTLMQFFESPTKPASRKSTRVAMVYLARLLAPYHTEQSQIEVKAFIDSQK